MKTVAAPAASRFTESSAHVADRRSPGKAMLIRALYSSKLGHSTTPPGSSLAPISGVPRSSRGSPLRTALDSFQEIRNSINPAGFRVAFQLMARPRPRVGAARMSARDLWADSAVNTGCLDNSRQRSVVAQRRIDRKLVGRGRPQPAQPCAVCPQES